MLNFAQIGVLIGGNTTEVPYYQTLLFGDSLTSLPSNFSITSEFSFTGGVLNSTGTNSSWTSFAGWSYLSSQDWQKTSVNFNINSTTSVFRVLKYSTNSWAKSGSVAEINFENSLISLYNGYSYPTIPTSLQTEPITITINTSHDYHVYFQKYGLVTKIVLTNLTTGESNVLIRTQSGSGVAEGIFRGQVALMHVKGNIDFYDFNYYALTPASPKFGAYGDSYIDGYSLDTALRDRWTYRAFYDQVGNAIISGWGGNSSADLITRSKDYENITPINVVLHVGYNDSVFATWQTNIQTLIRTFENKGAKIFLVTYAPLTTVSAAAIIANLNSYVVNSGYSFLDIGALLTVGGDRVTLDSSLILDDNAHPNVAGHNLIYNAYKNLSLNTSLRTLMPFLVSAYRFESNVNDSRFINNGTAIGTPTYTTGKVGSAISLNGTTQYVRLADSNTLSFGNAGTDTAFSFSAWVYVNSLSATNYIIAKRVSSLEYQFSINTSGALQFVLFSAGAGSATLACTSPNSSISTSTWYFVTATYDGTKTQGGLKLYINSVSQSLTNTSVGSYAGMNNTTSQAIIGGFNNSAGGYNGRIDEMQIWSKELTQSDIDSLYNSGSGITFFQIP